MPAVRGMKVDLNHIPTEFPPGPPEEWKNIPPPSAGSMPVEQLNRVSINSTRRAKGAQPAQTGEGGEDCERAKMKE